MRIASAMEPFKSVTNVNGLLVVDPAGAAYRLVRSGLLLRRRNHHPRNGHTGRCRRKAARRRLLRLGIRRLCTLRNEPRLLHVPRCRGGPT